jgi:hypothetical protein
MQVWRKQAQAGGGCSAPSALRAVWMYYLKAIFFRNKGLVVRVEVLFNLSHARPDKVQQEVVAKFLVVPFVP